MTEGLANVTTPRPRDVPGFADARVRGRVPAVPTAPPAVSVSPTAKVALRDVGLTSAAGVTAILVVLAVAGVGGRLTWPGIAALLAVSAAGMGAVGVAVRRWGDAQVAELQRGYTTTTFSMGRFWFASTPGGPVTNGWVQWRWDATWVMHPDGRVVSEPHAEGDPPGLYPSPRREGALELWTGHQWTGHLRDEVEAAGAT